MKLWFVNISVLASLIAFSTPSVAQETSQDSTEYTFEDENVLGELEGVTGVSITSRPRGKERSLIRVRTQFVYEMLKSVESM